MNLHDTILDNMPEPGSKNSYRLQCSLSIEEASELHKLLVNPSLPFNGDMTLLMRTAVRWFLLEMNEEVNDENSFISGVLAVAGAPFMQWTRETCDTVAKEATYKLNLCLDSHDLTDALATFYETVDLLDGIKHGSSKLVMKTSLIKRGFLDAVSKLREAMLQEDVSVYDLDNRLADSMA